MKILSIDTSSNICSVAILEDKTVLKEINLEDGKTHSQNLMPMIQEIMDTLCISLNNIDLLSCSKGPGSFTGVRIGISTIKAFADVKEIPTIGVSSLETLAYNISEEGLIAPLIDAKNDQVYFGLFELQNGTYIKKIDYQACHILDIFKFLANFQTPITFVGDASSLHQDMISQKLANQAKFAKPIQNKQSAASVGKVAFDKYMQGKAGTSNDLLPLYLRKSGAERMLEKKDDSQ
jgi:universal bacterial protein yeaZ